MSDDERHTRTVTLEVNSTGVPIRGIARDARGTERVFSGWGGSDGAGAGAGPARAPERLARDGGETGVILTGAGIRGRFAA